MGDEIISVFGCGVDRGFESLSGQIKDYEIVICSSVCWSGIKGTSKGNLFSP